jgi:hypothetical protein
MGITGGVYSRGCTEDRNGSAKAPMMTSALLQRFISWMSDVLLDLRASVEVHEYDSIRIL